MAMLDNEFQSGMLAETAFEMAPALPDLLTFTRAAQGVGAAGGTAYDWANATTIASNVPGNIQNVSPRESAELARRGLTVSNKIFGATDVAVLLGDRVADPNVSGRYYVVTFISDMAGMHSAFKIYVNLVQ